jgi:tRNA(His) guanylyltransferase
VSDGRDPLGDRMKRYEEPYRFVLPRRTYTVIRVDGRAFHTFLAHADKPWDAEVVTVMRRTAERLCLKLAGCCLAYTQSDEISFVLQDFKSHGTEPWFGGVVQKIASVAASTATAIFTTEYAYHFDTHGEEDYPTFDARVFTISDPVEVANYLVWRQRDCVKNSIGTLAHYELGPQKIHGLNSDQRQELLFAEKGINWNDVEPGLKRGWLARKVRYGEGDAVRTRWETSAAPTFAADSDSILAALIPTLPTLRHTAPTEHVPPGEGETR